MHGQRYERQKILPQIGPAGQQRLAAARLLLVGCGALGCTLADLLVRAGVGWLRIVDRDLVEPGNLQRQTLFDEADAAAEIPKAVAATRRLLAINSSVRVEPIVADANPTNIESLVAMDSKPADLILDGTDNVATRYLLNDIAVKLGIDWVYGACVGVGGRVMGIKPGRSACLRCLFPNPPVPSELETCDTSGVLGPAAVAVASLQAAAAMRLLLGQDATGLVWLDAWEARMGSMTSGQQPQSDCPCCAKREFPFLGLTVDTYTATLCGRQAVQVQRCGNAAVDLAKAAGKLGAVGQVQRCDWFVRCKLFDPPELRLTLFGDGRLMVQGTSDPVRAKSIYARFIGS